MNVSEANVNGSDESGKSGERGNNRGATLDALVLLIREMNDKFITTK